MEVNKLLIMNKEKYDEKEFRRIMAEAKKTEGGTNEEIIKKLIPSLGRKYYPTDGLRKYEITRV